MSRNSPSAKPVRTDRRDWRRVIQVGLVALLAVDVAFFVLGFLPSTQTYADQRKELDSLREELAAKRELVARLKKIEAGLAEARKQDDNFYTVKFLPRATGYSQIMEEVDKLAQASGVKKGSVAYSAQEIKGRSDLIAVGITTGLEGEYSKIVRFINRLEQSPLFLTVDSLGVSTGQLKTIKLSLKLVTYFRIGGPETGGGKTAADQAATRLWPPAVQLPEPKGL